MFDTAMFLILTIYLDYVGPDLGLWRMLEIPRFGFYLDFGLERATGL